MSRRPADVLLGNQIKRLNQMMKFDTLSEGKFAVFSLSNSSELPKMTASEFIEKAKEDDTSVEQCQWAEKMTDEFLDKLNKGAPSAVNLFNGEYMLPFEWGANAIKKFT